MKTNRDPKVDAYIDEAEKFAQPVLKHLRKLVHQACPEVREATKWSMPFFVWGKNLCFMAAFKEHCGFGFWSPQMRAWLKKEGVAVPGAMGSFGRIKSRKDLPGDKTMLRCLRQAVKFNETGKPARSPRKK